MRWRLALALTVFLISLVYALPSFLGQGSMLESVLPQSRVNLGLDLRGGIHLTLGVDVAKAVSNSLAILGQDLRRQAQDERFAILRPSLICGHCSTSATHDTSLPATEAMAPKVAVSAKTEKTNTLKCHAVLWCMMP